MRDSAGTGTATSNSGTIFDVGARYRWVPNGVSLVYTHGEDSGSADDNDGTALTTALRVNF